MMNSPRQMPCVLVLPPRSMPPGFHSRRICCSKLEMMESRNASSSGISFSSAIFKPSLGRRALINLVTKRAIGSRRTASNAGRKSGSTRRSRWSRKVEVSLSQSRNFEPVLARGNGRLAFEFNAASGSSYGKLEREVDQFLFAPENDAEINPGRHFANLVPDPFRDQRGLGVIEDDADLLVEPALVLVNLGHDRLVA